MKKHDFIEVEYTGYLEDGTVFDTTSEDIAIKNGLKNENTKFGPAIICLGENHVLPGIEKQIIGKKPGSFKIELNAEDAFGKKNPKMLKLMPMKLFKKEQVHPVPGLEVNIDNMYGIVRSVSGGRVIVDFNHPLSGRNVKYDFKVNKEITDLLIKSKSVFKNELNVPDMKLEMSGKTLLIDEEKFPVDVLGRIETRIKELIPEISKVMLKKDFNPAAKKTAEIKSEKKAPEKK
ncbi:peptidylprolyl isomerase [archaeon]|jgi:FKBP-type peptidyl-prolyl cis-trans isomerase 2|nr:peptidylprolyl isomerase [archaeon]MBT4023234.1 peptidylprolyl isomerase [archaeon]MBT4271904.1 peptidylprolyl isomerase [archaeon]MBT4461003.1 peptidylprolyl isomerase [archaeon]MBT4858421.1 peptidylprolyl isomerase [archaeon]